MFTSTHRPETNTQPSRVQFYMEHKTQNELGRHRSLWSAFEAGSHGQWTFDVHVQTEGHMPELMEDNSMTVFAFLTVFQQLRKEYKVQNSMRVICIIAEELERWSSTASRRYSE